MLLLLVGSLVATAVAAADLDRKYTPDWTSLDARPLPAWYDTAKFGIFCHWGVYSVPAYRSEWFWWAWQGDSPDRGTVDFVKQNWRPGWTYADFARDFRADRFDAYQFKDVIEASGARYFVLTSKHHEGFTLWPSPTSWNWNAVDVGPKRDLVGELQKAFKGSTVEFGLYFSLLEWFHPLYKTNKTKYVEEVSFPQLHEIVEKYKPSVIWSDGDWGTSDDVWRSKEFLAWLYNESPVKDKVVVNDRWGDGCTGKHGGFMTYSDHYDPGKLLERKWENCMTLDSHSWGHRKDMTSLDVHDTHSLIEQLARTVACGGNFLLNVGPDQHVAVEKRYGRLFKSHDLYTGRIPPIFEDRLRELGAFVHANEKALYGTSAHVVQNDTANTWYTRSKNDAGTTVFAWILDTKGDTVRLEKIHATDKTTLRIPALPEATFTWKSIDGGIEIDLTSLPWRKLPRSDAVVIAITNPDSRVKTRHVKSWRADYVAWLNTLQQKPRF